MQKRRHKAGVLLRDVHRSNVSSMSAATDGRLFDLGFALEDERTN